MSDLKEMAREGVHGKVLSYLEGKNRGRVLDIPSGPGALAKKLKDMGFEVAPCDIVPVQFCVEGISCEYADLNHRLPFKDEEFDYVCCVEGFEHTENPYNAMRELSRVLKKGGELILTTPNYLNIERRLKFLLTGCFTKPVSMEVFREEFNGNPAGLHLSTMGWPQIKFALEAANFKIKDIQYDKKKPRQRFLKPLILFIRLFLGLYSRDARKRYLVDETTSKVILEGGNTLIIFAGKEP